jgi:hypothetical protein
MSLEEASGQDTARLVHELRELKPQELRTVLDALSVDGAGAMADAVVSNIAHVPKGKLGQLGEAVSDRSFSVVVDLVRRRAEDEDEDGAVKKDLTRVVRVVAKADRSVVIGAARREVRDVPTLLRTVEPRPGVILKQAEEAVRDAARNDDERTLADELDDILRRFAAAHASEI